jgi:hypothetical protein
VAGLCSNLKVATVKQTCVSLAKFKVLTAVTVNRTTSSFNPTWVTSQEVALLMLLYTLLRVLFARILK